MVSYAPVLIIASNLQLALLTILLGLLSMTSGVGVRHLTKLMTTRTLALGFDGVEPPVFVKLVIVGNSWPIVFLS